METVNKPFEAERSFGLGVLLKLTQKNIKGIRIRTSGNKFTSNVSLGELRQAVEKTLKRHHIRLIAE